MNIDLETCILAFLIGVALYFLVNRVFMVEGASNKIKDTKGCQEACNTVLSGQGLTCEWVNDCPNIDTGLGCNIGGIHENCRACGSGFSPCQSPSPSSSPSPSPSPSSPPIKEFNAEEFKNYLKYEDEDEENGTRYTTMSINWKRMKSEKKSTNGNLYSSITCALARGEDVRFTEPELTSKKSVANLIIDGRYILTNNDDIDLTLSFVIELLKFINHINLKKLRIIYTKGDISVLGDMGGVFPSLTYLDLSDRKDMHIRGDISVLKEMRGVFPKLQYLDLSETSIYGYISVLSDMKDVFPKLKYLNLSETSIYGDISVLGKMRNVFHVLESLNLSNTSISGDISVLGDMKGVFPSLTDLDLRETSIYGDISVLKEMRGVFPSLVRLYLGETSISGNISVLGDMKGVFPKLRFLDLSHTSISGNISELGKMRNVFPELEDLDLNGTSIYGDISVLGDMKGVFPSLERLDLSDNSDITGDISVLGDMKGVFPKLRFLYLSYTRITGNINRSIKEIFPNLDYVNPSDLIFDDIPDYCRAPLPSSTPSPK